MLAELAAAAATTATAAQDYLSAPSVLGEQISAAAMSAWVIQQMKKSDWPIFKWIHDHSTVVTRIVSVGFAILSTSGIHAFWHGNAESIAGGGTFALVLADGWIDELKSSIWKTTQSFVMQQMVYQGLIKHEPGQKAADVVAETVVEKKEALAEVVVAEERKDKIQEIIDPGKPKPKIVEPVKPLVKLPWQRG